MKRNEEIEKRLAEIKVELDKPDTDLDALEEEVRALRKEQDDMIAAEAKRVEMRKAIAGGSAVVSVISEKKENEKMENRNYSQDSAEYRSAFLRNLQGKELTIEERTAVTAAGTIPTETMNRIVGKLEDAPMIAAVNTMYIPGNVSIPVAGTVGDASWVAMGTAATDSADTVTTVSLAAYKLIKTVEITADLAAMSVDAFETWLVDQLSKKISAAVDSAICTGDGSSKATGILASGAVAQTGTYTKAGMTYKDLCKIIAKLPTQYLPGASFAMPRALFYGEVLGMTDTSGNRVVVADAQAPAKFNILGYPVIVDDNITADNVIFGDLREGYTFNFAQAPAVRRDESAGFRAGTTVYRAMALADGKVVNKDALCVFTRATA